MGAMYPGQNDYTKFMTVSSADVGTALDVTMILHDPVAATREHCVEAAE